jgi:hypothetical protein
MFTTLDELKREKLEGIVDAESRFLKRRMQALHWRPSAKDIATAARAINGKAGIRSSTRETSRDPDELWRRVAASQPVPLEHANVEVVPLAPARATQAATAREVIYHAASHRTKA